MFHYLGHREATAPKMQVAIAARKNDERTETVPFTDEHLSTMRNALGLPASADEPTIVAALVEALNEQAEEAPKNGPVAKLPDGVSAVADDVLEQLRADAAAGREAREIQQKERRERLVADAFRTGKITAKGREGWLKKLEVEGPQAEADLDSLQAGLVPVEEKGHDFGSVAEAAVSDDDPDAVRQSPGYQNWRF